MGCGLQKLTTFSKKHAKTLTIFFFIFSFFWKFWWDQTGRSQVWVSSKWCQEAVVKILDFFDKRAKSYACFTYLKLWFLEGTIRRRRRQLGHSVPGDLLVGPGMELGVGDPIISFGDIHDSSGKKLLLAWVSMDTLLSKMEWTVCIGLWCRWRGSLSWF